MHTAFERASSWCDCSTTSRSASSSIEENILEVCAGDERALSASPDGYIMGCTLNEFRQRIVAFLLRRHSGLLTLPNRARECCAEGVHTAAMWPPSETLLTRC